MLVLGIDDAGRGPLIGPMTLAGVLLTKEQEKLLKKEGATDSKLLTHPQRIRLAEIIKKNSVKYKVVKVSAKEIDTSLTTGTNLNSLEAKKSAEILSVLDNKKDKIKSVIDCPSINKESWKKSLLYYLSRLGGTNSSNLIISCEHKADLNHTSAAAASILAKVAREEEVSKLKEKYSKYGNLGSGYPSDPITKEFLIKNGKELSNSGIFRKTWSTWKKLYGTNAKEQKKLFDYVKD